MSRPIEAITNGKTGETIYQEMGDVEFSIFQLDRETEKLRIKTELIEKEKLERTRLELLARLGITEEEASLLAQSL